jgi:hypothetical protein
MLEDTKRHKAIELNRLGGLADGVQRFQISRWKSLEVFTAQCQNVVV